MADHGPRSGGFDADPRGRRTAPASRDLRPRIGRPAGAPPRELLQRLIEDDILPRLENAEGGLLRQGDATKRRCELGPRDHERFLDAVLHGPTPRARHLVSLLLRVGVSRDAVLLELLPEAARRLGALWDEDRCGFAEAAIAVCRLHELLREPGLLQEEQRVIPATDAPRILLATTGRDTHALGLLLVAQFFQRAGWCVEIRPGSSGALIGPVLAEERFDVLGISVTRRDAAAELAGELRWLRTVSLNPALQVLLGGRMLGEEPDLVDRIGADGSAPDALSAPAVAALLLRRDA